LAYVHRTWVNARQALLPPRFPGGDGNVWGHDLYNGYQAAESLPPSQL
jgi:hypothetical protein